MKYVAILALLAGCRTPESPVVHPGIVPASLTEPARPLTPTHRWDSCDDPHPLNADGSKKHDWMVDGLGVWRCWYCDVVRRP
jgi:hypothetical protein